jgi:hypothetical protein
MRTKIEKLYDQGKLKLVTKKLSNFMKMFFSSSDLIRSFLDVKSDIKLQIKIVGKNIRQHHYECSDYCVLD